MSMWEPFTERARHSIVLAQEAAQRYGSRSIGTQYIILSILEISESPLLPLFEQRGLSIDAYRERVSREAAEPVAQEEMVFESEAKRLIEDAFAVARELGTRYIAPEHIVAAVSRNTQSKAARHLLALGFDLDAIHNRMIEELKQSSPLARSELVSMRRAYRRSGLSETDVKANPIEQLQSWVADAGVAKLVEPNAMCVATADAEGRPSSRMVLLRGLDERGLVFFTSYLSRKGVELGANHHVAALFYWGELERQVRIEGVTEPLPDEESDAYFASRPRGHQLAAWASEQSEPVESRALLEQRVLDYAARFEGEEVPRPHSWGGYLIRPSRIEFWQGRENRLHDRLEFTKDGTAWRIQRLSP